MPHFCFPSLVDPEKFVELIRRDYKGAVLCPFPWCEDELQLNLSNIFTRLQIVNRRKERSKLTDDTVNMTDVFKPHPECDSPRVVLIEGNPGMGKTTYCQKVAYDWSEGKIPPDASFPEVKILLLLKCRDMHMKTANIEDAIDDQLLPQDAGKKEKEDFFHFIRSNQSRILLVLDGLDELRDDLVKGFQALIQGKVFPNMYLMLTARHELGMKVRRYCDTLLEIVGYSHVDVIGYIRKYFTSHENKSLADKMIFELVINKNVRELMVNPLNAALLCLLYEETRGVLPSKKNELYDVLVSCALRRYFANRGISLGDEDPVQRCATQLNQLGKMAFEALLKNQLYFSHDEVKSHSTEDFLQLPFLSREPSVSKIRPTPCYAFTHKTFQEYFAAFYLVHQLLSGNKEKERLLDEISPFDNWQVWEFLIPMVSRKSGEAAEAVVSRLCAFDYHERFKDENSDFFEEYFEKNYNRVKKFTRWSKYEDKLSYVVRKTLDLIAKCEDGDNELKDYQKKMVHVIARCFPLEKLQLALRSYSNCNVCSEFLKVKTMTELVLHHHSDQLLSATIKHPLLSKEKLVHLSLKNETCKIDAGPVFDPPDMDQSLRKALLAELFQTGCLLTHVSLQSTSIADEGAQVIAEFLQANRSLRHLNLCAAMIRDRGATELGNALQSNCTLTHLGLPRNKISSVGAEAIATSLQFNSVLIYLDLSQNAGGNSIAMALAQGLGSIRALKYLVVSNGCPSPFEDYVFPTGGSALARALQLNCTLTDLDLELNAIGASGAATFGEALQTNSTLIRLNLRGNKVGEKGAVALGKAMQSNCTLTHLNLRSNNINSNEGIAAIARALQSSCGRLTRLDLCQNNITCSGATAIAEALHTNSSLTHLYLKWNEIKSPGASAFAKALEANRTLTHLCLCWNDIGESGARDLAHALKNHNTTLVYLSLSSKDSILRECFEQRGESKCIVCFRLWSHQGVRRAEPVQLEDYYF